MNKVYELREWKTSDLDSLVKHADNRNVSHWLTNRFPYPYTEEDGKVFIGLPRDNAICREFAIVVDDQAVGGMGIYLLHDINEKCAEIGYWLSEQYWGRGIVASAIVDMTEYGFANFDIIRIFARAFGRNKASQRVLEKAGFQYEATHRKAIYKDGVVDDEIIYVKFRDNESI